jgi:CheY-like chemotaxis protein
MLASEYPEMRTFLREIVETEDRAVIIGQAENATKALTLAKNLRPDVAIIDSYLPHTIGLDTIALSRIGGLDIAQTISEEIPNVRVVLLNSPDVRLLPERSWGSDIGASLCKENNGTCIPFTLSELGQEAVLSGALVFANVEANVIAAPGPKATSLSNKAIFFGALGILVGWLLIVTMFLAGAGVFVALAGAAAMLIGLVGKLTTSLRTKKS